MSDESTAPAGDTVSIPLPSDAPAAMTVSEAASLLSKARRQAAEPPAEIADEPQSPEKAEADPATDPSIEEPRADDPEETPPPIERPRSWAKELDEEWASYPREAQERIAKREQERDSAIRRSQNEIAEQRKAVQAEREAAEKAKQDYLGKLPTLEDIQRHVQQGPFSDIKNQDDVDALAQADPFRYLQWDAYQKRLVGMVDEAKKAEALKAQEKQTRRATYEAEQNKLLVELVPEVADSKKLSELRDRAVKMLTDPDDIGLKNDQLSRWMADDTGHEILSNAGIQKLIADGLKYRDLLKAPKAVAAKPLPPVQKPGVAKAGASSATAQIQALEQKLNNATGSQAIQIAADLTRLKRTVAR